MIRWILQLEAAPVASFRQARNSIVNACGSATWMKVKFFKELFTGDHTARTRQAGESFWQPRQPDQTSGMRRLPAGDVIDARMPNIFAGWKAK